MVAKQRLRIVQKFNVLYLGSVNAFALIHKLNLVVRHKEIIGMRRLALAYVYHVPNGHPVILDMRLIQVLKHVLACLFLNMRHRF